MKSVLATALLAVFSSAAAASAVLDRPLVPDNNVNLFAENGDSGAILSRRIPTSYESAVLARRILALVSTGTISTVFPHEGVADADSLTSLPSGLAGIPVGLPEYIANCEEDDDTQRGNPTVLAIRIATSFRNAAAGSNVSLTLEWVPPAPAPAAPRLSLWDGLQRMLGQPQPQPQQRAHHATAPSPAALPRFSLIGYLEPIPGRHGPLSPLATCFVRAHPDAKWWLPGNAGVHASDWMRLVVTHVYWIGGFGDRAYIGWIPRDEWHNVTRAEWEQAVLPGEPSGWREGGDL